MNRSKLPSPTFSSIEIEKYQRYANFGIDVEVIGDIYGEKIRGKNLKNANPDYAPIAKYQPPPAGGHGIKTNIFRNMPVKTKLLLAAGAGITAGVGAGVGGTMFMRRRRTKKGKVVVEQVRR